MSSEYWDRRYRSGGDSGAGSRDQAAQVKADYVNALIRWRGVASVADWGCGDCEVLSRLNLDGVEYVGVDISAEAIALCLRRRPDVTLIRLDTRTNAAVRISADLVLSLDVVFHFPDETDLTAYLAHVFASAKRLVLLHATDFHSTGTSPHVQHRRITPMIEHEHPQWTLTARPELADRPGFYLYERR